MDNLQSQDPEFRTPEAHQQHEPGPALEQSTTTSHHNLHHAVILESSTKAEGKHDLYPDYDPPDHGFRRIMRNFTPSYVPRSCPSTHKVPTNSRCVLQVVHHHHEHWCYLDHAPSITLQRTLATGHLGHLLRHESRSLCPLHRHFGSAVHALPSNFSKSPPTSTSESVLGYIPCGSGNVGQHDRYSLRAGMGSRHGHPGLDLVVDSQCSGTHYVFPPHVRDVGAGPDRAPQKPH